MGEELLNGLKAALARGESLKQAMMSFYNAGYKKEDIEAAARALHEQESGQLVQQTQPVNQVQKTQQPESSKTIQRVSSYGEKPAPAQQIKSKPKEIPSQPTKTVQRVSNYEQKPAKPKGKWLLFFMIFILLVLLGILAGIFFFKSELTEFFNGLF